MQLLPGPGAIPREGWLNQHHDATRRPGRGMLHQLHVNYIEDRDSITLIGEERVEGVDLGALVARTGPLALGTAQGMAKTLNTALDALEKQAGSCAVWWLPAGNVLLLTGTRSLSGSAGLIERKGPGAWAAFPLKFRLHQTLPTLKEGVNLPSRVRHLSRLPGKQYESVRRSANALPLLWYLLTGTRFRWSRPVPATDEVPAALAALFEQFRQQLRAEPTDVSGNLFLEFATFDPASAAASAEPLDEATEMEAAPAPDDGDHSLEQVLKSTLYAGEIDLTPVAATAPAEAAGSPKAAETSDGAETPDATEPLAAPAGQAEPLAAPVKKRSLAAISFWSLVLGVVLACVAGFALSGWSFQRGLFREADAPVFSVPPFRLLEGDIAGVARSALEDLLVLAGEPGSLALLPHLDQLELGENRARVTAWLENRAGTDKGEAHRVLGLLAQSRGEAPAVALAHFREAGKRGDLESQFRYATLQWSDESGLAADDALPLLEMAASRGHDAAQELLARAKLSMNDHAGAYKWAESAARQGRAPAAHLLGLFFLNGTGCEPDPAAAVEHLRSAAELGDERAMYDYGRCLGEGIGVVASFTEAQRWMQIASSRGHGPALRWCLDRGIDVSDGTAP
jgi:TPR repeat protein